MTGQLKYSGRIGISHAVAVGKVRTNGDLSRGFDAHPKKKSGKMGILHKI